jgi:hypothetical protein
MANPFRLSIKTNFPEVQRQLADLQADVAQRAAVSAVNKVMAQGKTAMSKEIRAEFNISAAKVGDALVVNRATFRNGLLLIEASLESPTKRGRSLNLINFGARQTAQGVTLQIKRNGGRILIRGAFIGNQGRTVFIRVGKSRLPIEALQTIGVAQMFNTKRVNTRVLKFITDKFPELFEHEVQFYTDRFNRARAAL